MTSNQTHLVFVGIATTKFSRLLDHVQSECGYRISHLVTSLEDVEVLLADGVPKAAIHHIDLRNAEALQPSTADRAYLASLEGPGIPTVHNMILADPYARAHGYAEALAYAAHLARGLQAAYRELVPSVVVAGHDRMLAALSAAVAAKESVRWYSLNFSVLPVGYIAASKRVVPDELVRLTEIPLEGLRERAARLLTEFEGRSLRAPAYVSAHTPSLVIRKLGVHAKGALKTLRRQYGGETDRFNTNSIGFMARQYFRKRANLLSFPKAWFLTEPPKEPYLFFGLHMQPESSIDVYAPFFANQFDTVEKVVRAIPPTHKLLVKLHISDADNYSRAQLRRLRRLPGVLLVLPSVWSRPFLEQCAGVIAITGTMGLEGALLGKPVVALGRMAYANFPTVARAGDLHDLPEVIRAQLSFEHPGREAIVDAYADYLSHYVCATGPHTRGELDDWNANPEPSIEERAGFVEFFRALEGYAKREAAARR